MTTTETTPAVYELRGVSRSYGSGTTAVNAVNNLDLTIGAGEYTVIAGPSGSGKTTLLQLLGGLDRPTAGELLFEGRDIAHAGESELTAIRRTKIGFVFQQFNLIPTLTARQNVEVALAPTKIANRTARAQELLETVGLGARAEHLPSQMSGGEQQRVAIARALANHPDVLLADEPTGNLDSASGSEIVTLLRNLADEKGHTVLVITHDPAIAAGAPRVIRLRDGKLEEPTSADDEETNS